MGSASKRTWTQYEELLGLERIVNRKFLSMLAENSQKIYEAKKPRVTPSYREYLLANSNFATGEGMAPFFPRRYAQPKY